MDVLILVVAVQCQVDRWTLLSGRLGSGWSGRSRCLTLAGRREGAGHRCTWCRNRRCGCSDLGCRLSGEPTVLIQKLRWHTSTTASHDQTHGCWVACRRRRWSMACGRVPHCRTGTAGRSAIGCGGAEARWQMALLAWDFVATCGWCNQREWLEWPGQKLGRVVDLLQHVRTSRLFRHVGVTGWRKCRLQCHHSGNRCQGLPGVTRRLDSDPGLSPLS